MTNPISQDTVEKVAEAIWDCVPSMCDETWAEAKEAVDDEHKQCVSTYYAFAKAAITALLASGEVVLRSDVEKLVDALQHLYEHKDSAHVPKVIFGKARDAILTAESYLGKSDESQTNYKQQYAVCIKSSHETVITDLQEVSDV